SNSGLTAQLAPTKAFSHDWPSTLESCFAEQLSTLLELQRVRGVAQADASSAAKTMDLVEWAYRERTAQRRAPFSPTDASRPSLPPGRTVVTGGTGFIGSHLIERLAELGHDEIRVPIRGYATAAEAARFPISTTPMDLLDSAAVRGLVDGARWVFHLAYGRDGANQRAMTVDGTRNVVEAAIAAGCECVVVLSTIYVFGDNDQIIDEDSPYRPKGNEYGVSKTAMERWCLERAATSGSTRIVVLNPS